MSGVSYQPIDWNFFFKRKIYSLKNNRGIDYLFGCNTIKILLETQKNFIIIMYNKFGQFIDGKWQQSTNKETYEVINPATE